MKLLLKIVGVLVACAIVAGVGFYVWASVASSRALTETYETHTVDFPIPFPAMDTAQADADTAGATAGDAAAPATDDTAPAVGPSPDARAMTQAIERGGHLIHSRYACVECHGADLGGGVMIDSPVIGQLLGPNLTTGRGSRTLDYTPADWDRAVRHGVLPDGRPSIMPAIDFARLSDQELSDIVAYIRAQPAVDNEVPPVALGPLGKVLIATGELPLSAALIEHNAPHAAYPPETAATLEFGEHMAAICTGCHREDFAGGPIVGGDPSWPPAANLTPHAEGLAGWTYEDFATALRQGVRPDGSALLLPMSAMTAYAQNMTDIEIQALWMFLQSRPPLPDNK